ncbi:hypothetical protein AU195_05570 [Mycobacterium sp. IS-1496]|nr:hypothetical protein AU195_05570 [Mycobacterium sp. IS-1496]
MIVAEEGLAALKVDRLCDRLGRRNRRQAERGLFFGSHGATPASRKMHGSDGLDGTGFEHRSRPFGLRTFADP